MDAARIRGKVGLADDLAVWSGGCLGLGGQQKSCEECAESGGNKIHGASERSEREVYKARCSVLDLREASLLLLIERLERKHHKILYKINTDKCHDMHRYQFPGVNVYQV